MGSSKLSDPGPHLLCSLDLCMFPEAWLLVVIVFLPGQPFFLFSRIRKLQLLDQSITMGTRLYSHVTIYFRIPHWFPIILRTKPKLLTTVNWNSYDLPSTYLSSSIPHGSPFILPSWHSKPPMWISVIASVVSCLSQEITCLHYLFYLKCLVPSPSPAQLLLTIYDHFLDCLDASRAPCL